MSRLIGGSSTDFDRLCEIQRERINEYPWDEFHSFDERAEDERVATYEKSLLKPLDNWDQEVAKMRKTAQYHEFE